MHYKCIHIRQSRAKKDAVDFRGEKLLLLRFNFFVSGAKAEYGIGHSTVSLMQLRRQKLPQKSGMKFGHGTTRLIFPELTQPYIT